MTTMQYVYLLQQKKQKTNAVDTSCDGNNDNDRVQKKVVKRLRAELSVSFFHDIILTDIKLIFGTYLGQPR